MTVDKVTADEIEQLVSILKVDLHSCFGRHVDQFTVAISLGARRNLSFDILNLILIDVGDDKDLTLSDRGHLLEILREHIKI